MNRALEDRKYSVIEISMIPTSEYIFRKTLRRISYYGSNPKLKLMLSNIHLVWPENGHKFMSKEEIL